MNIIIISVGMVFAIIITAAASILLESGIINVSYAQVFQRLPSGSEVTTPGANTICDPTDRHVNTRESHVCGVPKTPSSTAAEPTTTESPSSITPGQNPMCDPTDRSINTTESHVCGVPKTPSSTAAEPTTTESPSSITPPPPSGTPEAPIPGLLPITTNSTQ